MRNPSAVCGWLTPQQPTDLDGPGYASLAALGPVCYTSASLGGPNNGMDLYNLWKTPIRGQYRQSREQ